MWDISIYLQCEDVSFCFDPWNLILNDEEYFKKTLWHLTNMYRLPQIVSVVLQENGIILRIQTVLIKIGHHDSRKYCDNVSDTATYLGRNEKFFLKAESTFS